MAEYSFCESVHAGPQSAWHIRKLTEVGRKLGGGIDTQSLCGRVSSGWDLDVELNEFHLGRSACRECLIQWNRERSEAEGTGDGD